MPSIKVKNKIYQLTEFGYLKDRSCWTEEIAASLAAKENIILTDEHWVVINFLREFYESFHVIPPLRIFIKNLREKHGEKLGNSLKLHQLFPESPLKYACMIAGIPKPKHCM